MSNLYGEFIYTNFPDQPYDTYEYMQDINSDLVDLASQYEALIGLKKFNDAANLLKSNPSLNRIYFNAEKYNKLIDSIRATQRLYSEDVRKYILELMSFKGEYSNLQKYIRYNVVRFNSMIYLCISDCPLGTLPTNTTYWYPLSIKGERGFSGLGLSFDGVYNSNTTYNKESAVSFGTCLYASTIDDNLANIPSKTSNAWELIINFNDLLTYDNSSSGLSSITYQDAITEVNSKVIKNTNKLNTIENGAQKNTVTGIKGNSESSYRIGNVNITAANLGITVVNNTADKDKSVKYATSAGSANTATTANTCTGNSATATNANYATSAGNSDTVDGFHFQISTTDLEADVSSLTTNMFYFVYE